MVLYQTALSMWRKVLQADDPYLGLAQHNISGLLLNLGKVGETRTLLEKALDILVSAYASNSRHPQTLKTAARLAAACLLDGDRGRAAAVAAAHGLDMDAVEQGAERIRQKWQAGAG